MILKVNKLTDNLTVRNGIIISIDNKKRKNFQAYHRPGSKVCAMLLMIKKTLKIASNIP